MMNKWLFTFVIMFVCILQANAQFISEVIEYTPAPGQLINTSPWGNPTDAASIKGGINGTLCLGAFGGYVVFKFENPVENHPDNPFGIDFTIFGNPQPNWSEPGTVWVMKDENGNGQPDEIWYELAGSDYWFSSTIKDYQVTYTNPGAELAADVPWSDNFGNSGFVYANAVHGQPYYPLHDSFPAIASDAYTLSGTLIKQILDTTNPGFVLSPQRAFGYADNNLRGGQPCTLPDNPYTPEKENSGGDAFDISWAVDASGNYLDLDEVDFVKVQNAVQDKAGWLGEISTEITGAADVEPNAAISGNLYLLVMKDLPPVIKNQTYQLEIFAFYKGRLLPDEKIVWQTNMPEATISESHQLTVTVSGELEITASLESNPEIFTSASTMVDLSSAAIFESGPNISVFIWPNPAIDMLHISHVANSDIEIMDLSGKIKFSGFSAKEDLTIDVIDFIPGVYIISIFHDEKLSILKFLKK